MTGATRVSRETRGPQVSLAPHVTHVASLLVFLSLAPLASFAGAYTNHADIAVCGVPVGLSAKAVSISNALETVQVPLSIFPERERRRLVADYVAAHPEAGTGALLVPRDIRTAVEGNASEIRRSQNRAAKELITKEESEAFCNQARAALRTYLDRQVSAGRLLPAERQILRGGAVVLDSSAK